jgi:hypothetical protein
VSSEKIVCDDSLVKAKRRVKSRKARPLHPPIRSFSLERRVERTNVAPVNRESSARRL